MNCFQSDKTSGQVSAVPKLTVPLRDILNSHSLNKIMVARQPKQSKGGYHCNVVFVL